jgi:hypothetical protein
VGADDDLDTTATGAATIGPRRRAEARGFAMDANDFDALTRTLVAGKSRRSLVRAVAGSLLGGVLAARHRTPAAAAPNPNGPCPFLDYCGPSAPTLCGIGANDDCGCSHADCGECRSCVGRPFVCKLRANGSGCSSDGNPCTQDICQNGRCLHPPVTNGTACGGGKVCSNGVCCAVGLTGCGNACVDLETNEDHCGACKRECRGNASCLDGVCDGCVVGQIACDDGCHNPLTDPNNCGECSNACTGGRVCANGVCCPPGQTGCDGTCVDLKTDAGHCGACGKICLGAKDTCCNGGCVDTGSNDNHCGRCKRKCGRKENCQRGRCRRK